MKIALCGIVAAVGLGVIAGCQTEPKGAEKKAELSAGATGAIDKFKAADASLQSLLDKSVGWVVYPDVSKAAFIAGGSFGRGEVFDKTGKKIGWSDIKQGTIGLSIGAQSFAELVVFMTDADFSKFKSNQLEFSADMSAVFASAGAAASANQKKGTMVFVKPNGGVMADMSLGGQKFTYQPN